ncbi:hypothetical protein M3Y96_01205300 [Aphelenchoides besseyi]|nr:hypothetical protein M3Y96_01205300 [Aphelenchoides besseyi]
MFDWTLFNQPTDEPLKLLTIRSNQTHCEYPPDLAKCFSFPAETIEIDFPATIAIDENHPHVHTAYKFKFTANDFLPVTYHSALTHLVLISWVQIVSTDRLVEILQHNFMSFLHLLPSIKTTLRLELINYSRFIETPMNMIDFAPLPLHLSDTLQSFLTSLVDSQTDLYELEFKVHSMIYHESKTTEIPLIIEEFNTVLRHADYRGILLSFKHKLLLKEDDNTIFCYW